MLWQRIRKSYGMLDNQGYPYKVTYDQVIVRIQPGSCLSFSLAGQLLGQPKSSLAGPP